MNRFKNLPDHEAARDYALNLLTRELSPTLCYHTLWHTQDEVVPRAQWLARRGELGPAAIHLVCTAAYFHDIGFTQCKTEHEVAGSDMAGRILPTFGYTEPQIGVIRGIILATRIPQSPRNRLEQIMADADLDVLGRADFLLRNGLLRTEAALAGRTSTDAVWYRRQIDFLRGHRYFTPAARESRAWGKSRNIAELQARIDALQPDAMDAAEFAAASSMTNPQQG